MATAAISFVSPAAVSRPAAGQWASVSRCRTLCTNCNLRAMCLPCGLVGTDIERVSEAIYVRKRVKRGETLYRAGEPFKFIYALRTGFCKSYTLLEDGREQVMGFLMPGDIMGLEGIESERHNLNVVALEDSEVCVIPFARLEELASEVSRLQVQFHRMMSREIVRDQGVMLLLGTLRSEGRVAAFLLNLSQRYAARGYAANEFHLRMTREEIGSYLGLKLETVSRALSHFHSQGMIEIRQKHVRIADKERLQQVTMQ